MVEFLLIIVVILIKSVLLKLSMWRLEVMIVQFNLYNKRYLLL